MVDHVAGCIESVRNQEPSVQHIIIDGGSTDGTLDAIKSLSHPDLQVISGPDKGQSDAINKGLNLAIGEVFNWLNADDRLKPEALEVVGELMTNDVDVVLGKCEHINAITRKPEVVGQTYFDGATSSSMANYAMAQPLHL